MIDTEGGAMEENTETESPPALADASRLAIVVLVVGGLAVLGRDPYLQIAAPTLALGTLGIIVLQATASLSIMAFFRHRRDRRLW